VTEPLYRRIAEDQRVRIETGELPPGSQLPTEPELMGRYRASRNTVRSAMQWLASRGLVETRPGQGCFVTEKLAPFVTTLSGDWQTEEGLGGGEGEAAFQEVQARDRQARVSTPRVELRLASGYVASQLCLPAATSVIGRHQNRYIDDQPWSIQTSYYPMALAEQGATRLLDADYIAEGSVRYVAATVGMKQVGYQDLLLVRAPGGTEAKFFGLPDDGRVPVVVLLRTGFADGPDGPRPFRLTESIFPADRNQFVISAGRVPGGLARAADL
jgi:GntR family transcriptional regulator